MPRGRSPTLINLTALRFATSITSTAAPSSALTYSHLPSGLNTTCSGFCPLTLTLVSSRRAADQGNAVVFLHRHGDPRAVARDPDALGRFSYRDPLRYFASREIHDHERAARLVAHVQPPAVGSGGDPARLARRLDGRDDPVARRVDHRHRSRFLVGHIGERRRTRLRQERERENR